MIKILYLAANPFSDVKFDITEEFRGIADSLANAPYSDQFTLEYEFNVKHADLRSLLDKYRPDIIHFALSGHPERGLFFADCNYPFANTAFRTGQGAVPWYTLDGAIPLTTCIILLIPISEEASSRLLRRAEALITVDHIISLNETAFFSAGFYEGLGAGKGISHAYKMGRYKLSKSGDFTDIRFPGKPIISWNKEDLANANTLVLIEEQTEVVNGSENEKRSVLKETNMENYTDFYLHVDTNGGIRAKSNEGERQGKISLDIPENVQLTLDLIEQDKTNEKLIKGLGKQFYEMLFPNSIHAHFVQTEAAARRNNQRVRIRLTIDPDMLANLPWEFIFRDEGGYFLSINPDTVLSHYLDVPLPGSLITKSEDTLDFLLIIAAPSDQPQLDPDEWEHIVTEALSEPIKQGKISVRVVKKATRRNISDALLQRNPNIVQFVGHGIYQDGKGYLALVDGRTGKTWALDDERFASMFLGVGSQLGLVSLATCESAKSDSPRSFLGIAPQIVQRGVPAVIAMQYSVLVSTAKIFLDQFYRSVAARKPLDWAVQSARNAVYLEVGLGKREFAIPVLYMRTQDGQVF